MECSAWVALVLGFAVISAVSAAYDPTRIVANIETGGRGAVNPCLCISLRLKAPSTALHAPHPWTPARASSAALVWVRR